MKKVRKLFYGIVENIYQFLHKVGLFVKNAMLKRSKSACWFNIATLLTGFAAFEVYRSLSLADAEYQGKKLLYYFSVAAPFIIWFVIIWEFVCLIGLERWKNVGMLIQKRWKNIKHFFGICSLRTKLIISCIAIIMVVAGCVMSYNYINKCNTEFYDDVMEFYGVADGIGVPLSQEELKNRAGYWRIDDYPNKHYMTLTYIDDYGQLELMRQYSSAYSMEFFQPPARIEYSYKKNVEKFRSYGQEYYEHAKKHSFREPKKITYYASNGKVLLELSGDGYEKLNIDVYSSDENPQLFHSTLLRVPDGQTIGNSVNSWQIETSYDSIGRPAMRKLSDGVCNLYGVNGEKYAYDSDNRLESIHYLSENEIPACNKQGIMLISFQYDEDGNRKIMYYNNENGSERTEGFYGSYCEEMVYDSYGNIRKRQQMDKQGRWCCDVNGVYRYEYDYKEGRLVSEAYYGVDERPVRNNQLDNSQSVHFSLETTEEAEVLEIFLDYQKTLPASEEVSEAIFFKNRFLTNSVFTQNEGMEIDEKNVVTGALELQIQNIGNVDESDQLSYDTDDKNIDQVNDQERTRNYTLIQNIITNDSLVVKYCDDNGANIKNERGYAEKRILYDQKMRVKEEAYLGLDGELCLIDDGIAMIKTSYLSKEDDKIDCIEYLDTDGEHIINKKEGYSSVRFQYGKQGESEIVTSSYYNSSGNPIYLPGLGYAAVDCLYNKNGLLIQETYRDIDGAVTYRNDYMVAEILYEYTDDGNLNRIWYKDTEEKPTNRLDTGYAVIYQEYEAGQMIRQHYEGYRNGVLCAVSDRSTGVCDTEYHYEKGRKQKEQYFDAEGNPTLRSDIGCAAISYEYDNNGNISEHRYYDMDEKLILCRDAGYAIMKCEYNDEEQYRISQYFGIDEKPIINQETHCAGIKQIYAGGKLKEIQYLDMDGNFLNRSDYGFARVCKEYDNSGKLITESYFNADGDRAVRKKYGYAMFENIYNEDGLLGECRYYDFTEDQPKLVMRRDTGFAIIRYEYDRNGNQKSETYFNTEDEPVISTKYHCAGILSQYDDYRNESKTQYIGLNGRLLSRDDYGFAQVAREFNPKTGKLLKEYYFDITDLPAFRKGYGCFGYNQSYDERGNWIETRYYDKMGKLTLREDKGYAVIRNEYNEYGELSAEYFYGENEESVISTEYHCAGILYVYDKKGNKTQTSYLGIDGNIAKRSDYGCAYINSQYDDAGRLVEEAYFDTDKDPVIRTDTGYASYSIIYENGKMKEQQYYGLEKELVPDKNAGYAIETWEYDEYGNTVLSLFYGIDKNPVISSKYQCAGIRSVYDEMGNETEIMYLDFDGGLMNRGDYGCAKICQKYDNIGDIVNESYFDAEEQPVIRKDYGFFSFENIYDAKTNRWNERRYYDTHEELTLHKKYGYAVIKLEYDLYGREEIYTFYGMDELPIISKSYYCAGMKYVYDYKGDRSIVLYLDTDGNLMTRLDFGCAIMSQDYGVSGHLIREEYLDLEGQPAIRKGCGFASYENIFAQNGTLLETRYYGLNGELALREDEGYGYAVVKYEYDEYGRMISKDFFGVDEKPIIGTEDHCAGITYAYDENGNNSEILYLGLDGRPIDNFGYVQIHKNYDDFGYVTQESYHDADGQSVFRIDVGYAFVNYEYDPYHRWVESRYYDTQKDLTISWETGTAILKLGYDKYGREKQYRYYGIDAQPVLNEEYFCYGMKYAYDDFGNRTKIQYLNSNGDMLIRSDFGCAQIQSEYDALGQLIKESYCDVSDRLIVRPEYGYAAYTIEYENGRQKRIQYLDTEENPIVRTDTGYAMIQYVYNELGQCIWETYHDAEERLVMSKEDNCAGYQFHYDERGNCDYIWYCGLDWESIVQKDYGAMLNQMKYDEYDHLIWDAYYNYDDSEYQPVVRKDMGYFAIQYTYNEQGKMTKKEYLDIDNNLIMHKENGYAKCKWIYNKMGQLKCIKYYNDNKVLVNIPEGYAKEKYFYDDSGNIENFKYFDASGNEVLQ